MVAMKHNEARKIAERMLDDEVRSAEADDDVVILDEHTVESDDRWVFTYNSIEYARTGDLRVGLLGNAPIIVNKVTGEAEFGRTNIAIDEQLPGYVSDPHSSIWRDLSEVFGEESDDDDAGDGSD
jgi:immunity protein 35 of polymorphic toxin system